MKFFFCKRLGHMSLDLTEPREYKPAEQVYRRLSRIRRHKIINVPTAVDYDHSAPPPIYFKNIK